MKTSFLKKGAIYSLLSLSLFSCQDSKPKFIVQGEVSNADSTMIYLERRSLNNTTIIDSARLDKDGKFKFSQNAIDYPEFYLLKLEDQSINIAIDSIETITVKTDRKSFSYDYTIDGSPDNKNLRDAVRAYYKLNENIINLNKLVQYDGITMQRFYSELEKHIDDYKKEAKSIINRDYSGLSSYFLIFQKIGDLLIFNPEDKKDLQYFRAVATAWDQFKPQSPRSEHLKNYTLRVISEKKQAQNNVEKLSKMIESSATSDFNLNIDLPSQRGGNVKLSDLKGKVVLLDFTAYQTDISAAYNVYLNGIYEKAGKDFEIYQISFDMDSHVWRNVAENLPWTCVRDNQSLKSELLGRFNVSNLPTSFILDKNGNLVKRLTSNDNIINEINKLK